MKLDPTTSGLLIILHSKNPFAKIAKDDYTEEMSMIFY